MWGEFPNVPIASADEPYDYQGALETGMVVCVESYIGCDRTHQGVKLENQYLITDNGAQCLTNYPFADALRA